MIRRGLIICLLSATAAAAEPYKAPRTPYGAPDLEGVWRDRSLTGLQRPKDFKALVATPYEAAAYEKKRRDRYETGIAPTAPDAPAFKPGEVEDESAQWSERPVGLARIRGEIRTSVIVEPEDGKLPYTVAARAAADKATKDEEVYDDPEGRPFDERCLLGGGGGVAPPIINIRDPIKIVQTRDSVVLFGEQNHEARIVRLGARHRPAAMSAWMGDSIGWWEGDTLVVETTNFSPSDRWRWNGGDYIRVTPATRVAERFTRVGADELVYAYTVEDPTIYTRTWRGEVSFRTTQQPMFEFACHEGNYALTHILQGGRFEDRAKAAAPAVAQAGPAK